MVMVRILLLSFALAGCAYESKAPPVSNATMQNGPPSQMPQSANSLPRGSAVSAPIIPSNSPGSFTRTVP